MKYDQAQDRESAFEMLAKKAEQLAQQAQSTTAAPAGKPPQAEQGGLGQSIKDAVFGTGRKQGMLETMAKQTARTVGSKVGQQIFRGLLGGLFGGKR